MKKIIIYIIYFCLSFIVPTFFLRSGFFEIHIVLKYLLIYIAYYSLIYFYFKVFKRSFKSFIWCILPIVVNTGLGFYVNFKDLFPIVFPASGIIFMFAFLQIFTARKCFLNFLNLSIIVLFSFFVYPKIVNRMGLYVENTNIKDYNFYSFLSHDSVEVNLEFHENYLLDFMFINCRPCVDKLEYLNKLAIDKKVFVIVNGDIDSYNSFKMFYNKNHDILSNLYFYYDPKGKFTQQFNIKIYPTELIIRNKSIIIRSEGFMQTSISEYINSRKKLFD